MAQVAEQKVMSRGGEIARLPQVAGGMEQLLILCIYFWPLCSFMSGERAVGFREIKIPFLGLRLTSPLWCTHLPSPWQPAAQDRLQSSRASGGEMGTRAG